jgi:hypothetical protein
MENGSVNISGVVKMGEVNTNNPNKQNTFGKREFETEV